jgi:hypothetical protein
MPRLIDADELLKTLNGRYRELMGWPVYHREFLLEATHIKEYIDKIKAAPTIPAEPIVYGEIAPKGEGLTHWYECSECGTGLDMGDKRCRECGTRFRKENEDA